MNNTFINLFCFITIISVAAFSFHRMISYHGIQVVFQFFRTDLIIRGANNRDKSAYPAIYSPKNECAKIV